MILVSAQVQVQGVNLGFKLGWDWAWGDWGLKGLGQGLDNNLV